MIKKFTPLLFLAPLMANTQVFIDEPFDGDELPAGWTQTTSAEDGGWLLGDAHELGSAMFPVKEHGNFIGANDKCFCNHVNDFLKTPTMDFTGMTEIWLMFDYSYMDFDPQYFRVEISTSDGVSWSTLQYMPSSAAGYYGWWERVYIDLSSYAGYDDVKIGFRYSDGGDWWSYGASLDNVRIFQPVANDISLDSVYVSGNYGVIGSNITLSGVVTNFGTDNLNSFTAKWLNGATEESALITGLDIEQFETYNFSHAIPFVPSTPDAFDIELSVTDPNGATDEYAANNSLMTRVHGTSSIPDKPAIAELATGTWCSWCVRGHVYMDSMYFLYPQDFIGIAVHNGDLMEIFEYDSAMYAYQNYLSYGGGASYPAIIAEHIYYMDPLDMPVRMLPFMNQTVPVRVNVFGEYNDTTGLMNIDVRAIFVSNMDDIDYRLNLVVKEDSVTGEGPAWAQSNAYAGGYYGPMAGYELLPSPVPADLMVYDHVARVLGDGWHGAEGSIPSSVNDLDTFYTHYEIILDEEWDNNHIKLIGMVIDNSSGRIVNAQEVNLKNLLQEPADTTTTDTTVVEGIADFINHDIRLFPNPADQYSAVEISLNTNAEVELLITDITGRLTAQKYYGRISGEQILPINTAMLEDGVYIVTILVNGSVINKQLTVYH